ncbi:hypothetical protein Scep_005905 [Stephania cephalantha]|uniref:PRC-barrel domain-containing protein n=1 Tax=Stephania cephalantha TaxID=152367 RepID=A0AAP0KVJ7_9MAGN
MCDCVVSPPFSPHSGFFKCETMESLRCDSKATTRRSVPPKTSNHGVFSRVSFKTAEFRVVRAKFLRIIDEGERLKSNCCVKAGSERYEFVDELGFEDNRDKGLDSLGIESRSRSAMGGIQSSDSSASNSFEVLEFSGNLDDEKRGSADLVNGDSTQAKCAIDVGSRSEEVGEFIGARRGMNGRQVIRRTNMLAKRVISIESAQSLGFVSQLWVDTSSWMVVVIEVRPSMLSGEMERFLLEDVSQVGDVVLVQDESVLDNDFKMIDLDALVGYSVVTPSRRSIGKVRGYTFNINSGAVELLELDSFGFSIIPSSLVSTYALFVEDVIGVESDTVVVQEAAASRVQRLTKGFWDPPKIGTIKEEVDEVDLERLPLQKRGRHRKKFSSKEKNANDDWQLPMDYL